jgi:hypothetical protein
MGLEKAPFFLHEKLSIKQLKLDINQTRTVDIK